MCGTNYLIDDELWEDSQDVIVSEARKDEPTVPWDKFKSELEQENARGV